MAQGHRPCRVLEDCWGGEHGYNGHNESDHDCVTDREAKHSEKNAKFIHVKRKSCQSSKKDFNDENPSGHSPITFPTLCELTSRRHDHSPGQSGHSQRWTYQPLPLGSA